MQYNTKILALCALLSIIIHASNGARGTMEIDVATVDSTCSKYAEKGNEYFRITHARVLIVDNADQGSEQMIRGNYLCNVDTTNEKTYFLKCDGMKDLEDSKEEGFYVMVSVTTKKQMLSGPIDYRYNEKVMKLVDNKFLEPKNLKNQKFEHNQHLHITQIRTNGVMKYNGITNMGKCHEMFPSRLIADHGLYAIGINIVNGEKKHLMWRMYFEPYGIGEYWVR